MSSTHAIDNLKKDRLFESEGIATLTVGSLQTSLQDLHNQPWVFSRANFDRAVHARGVDPV